MIPVCLLVLPIRTPVPRFVPVALSRTICDLDAISLHFRVEADLFVQSDNKLHPGILFFPLMVEIDLNKSDQCMEGIQDRSCKSVH
jgi:hypothetical protein